MLLGSIMVCLSHKIPDILAATFLENMQYQCTALTRPEEQGACMGMASLYHAGVSSTVGTSNYDAALAQLTCAAWVKDVTVNRC